MNIPPAALAVHLKSIKLEEFKFLKEFKFNIYILQNKKVRTLFKKGEENSVSRIKELLPTAKYFTDSEGIGFLQDQYGEALRQATRSLSMGPPEVKLKLQLTLLSQGLHRVNKEIISDEGLQLHQQAASVLASFLMNNQDLNLQQKTYQFVSKMPIDYVTRQTLLTALLIVPFFKNYLGQNAKDCENIFIANYFKDFGMGFIPQSIQEKEHLNPWEKNLLRKHAHFSVGLVGAKIPLNANFLELIRNHHLGSTLLSDNDSKIEQTVYGVETIAISLIDQLVALNSKRPYREAFSLFESLSLLKQRIPVQSHREFKTLVYFAKKFFSF